MTLTKLLSKLSILADKDESQSKADQKHVVPEGKEAKVDITGVGSGIQVEAVVHEQSPLKGAPVNKSQKVTNKDRVCRDLAVRAKPKRRVKREEKKNREKKANLPVCIKSKLR